MSADELIFWIEKNISNVALQRVIAGYRQGLIRAAQGRETR